MLNQVPFEKLFDETGEELRSLDKSLKELSNLFRNLPLSESIKKNFTEQTLKLKSAWYACLVNHNIDVLLLPEYLESKQSRNILIKKETDQYFKSIEFFDLLNGKSNEELFECILYSENGIQSNSGFDLFSSQVIETAKCPERLKNVMSSWNEKFADYDELTKIVFEFLEWHETNQYSFSSNRQIILWLNHRFRNLYGNISYMFNHEQYFFHHWNKESRDMKGSVKELIANWKKEADSIFEEINNLYKTQIGFDKMCSSQKIIANQLFENGFTAQYPIPVQMSQYPALKPLLKKGFVVLNDFLIKDDFEKYTGILNQLLESQFIVPVREEEIYISLNPSYVSMKGRLASFNNVNVSSEKIDWSEFIEQTISKPIVPEKAVTIELTELPDMAILPDLKPKRRKAFFG